MTFEVVIQPRAQREIWEAVRWNEEQSNSPTKALRWAHAIRTRIDTLRTHPRRCPIDPDSDAQGEEARLPILGKRNGKYRILLRGYADLVHVLAVRQAARERILEVMDRDEEGPED